MGRPPGAASGGTRRRHPQDWELRDPRFEELDSEDEDGQGVYLGYNSRDPRARDFVSDELYFDGHDVGQDRRNRRRMYDLYGDEYDSGQLEYRDQEGIAYQVARREKEEELIQSALERIARARSKGKTNVNLSEEEMEALERRRSQQPDPPEPPLASPPPTPAKPASKGKVGSRSNSSTNLASKTRKRNSSLFGSSPSPAKSNSKAKVNRKGGSNDQALVYPAERPPSGMMITGPNGVPVYAPVGYHGSSSPELTRSRPASAAPSRSGSKHRRRESTPPDRLEQYPPYPARYYLPPAGIRPESSGSNRSLPDDADWYPPPSPRYRSTSGAQYSGYPSDYDAPPNLPAAQGRRNFSGPPDVRYSNLRRMPPSSALVTRPPPGPHTRSDPAMPDRKSSGLSQEIGDSSTSRSSSSSSDEQGVQVELLPEGAGGNEYALTRAPVDAAVSRNEGRKRRAGRR